MDPYFWRVRQNINLIVVKGAKHMNVLFILRNNKRSIRLMAYEALFTSHVLVGALSADKLSNLIVVNCLAGFQVITTSVHFAMAFGTDENFKPFVYFLGRHLPEITEADIAV